MAAVTIHSDFGAQENKTCHCFYFFPFYFLWSDGMKCPPRWCSGKESTCQCRRHKRHGLDPCVQKIPWSRKWQPTPVSLLGKHAQRSQVGYSPWLQSQHDWASMCSPCVFHVNSIVNPSNTFPTLCTIYFSPEHVSTSDTQHILLTTVICLPLLE